QRLSRTNRAPPATAHRGRRCLCGPDRRASLQSTGYGPRGGRCYAFSGRARPPGGRVVPLADAAPSRAGGGLSQPPVSLLTASLTVDFYSAARLGDLLEAHTDVVRVGRRIAFGNCYLRVGDTTIARASGIFNVRTSTTEPPE